MRFHVSLQTSIKSNKTLFAMGKNLIEIFLLRYINFLHIPEDVTGLNWKGFSLFCRKGPFDNFIRFILCKHMSLCPELCIAEFPTSYWKFWLTRVCYKILKIICYWIGNFILKTNKTHHITHELLGPSIPSCLQEIHLSYKNLKYKKNFYVQLCFC